MVTTAKHMTVTEFDEWVNLPEQAEHLYEFIGGEIFEVPSNPYSSEIAGEILFQIKLFLRENKIDGHVTGESGGYEVSGERYAPDVAYIPSTKQAQLPYKQGYNPNPPDLAVEVISPTDSERVVPGDFPCPQESFRHDADIRHAVKQVPARHYMLPA